MNLRNGEFHNWNPCVCTFTTFSLPKILKPLISLYKILC